MKKIIMAIALTGLASSAAFAGMAAGTGINGSMHDINAAVGYTDDALQRTCVFCHTPHNAQVNVDAPLWNHAPNVASFVGKAYTWIAPMNNAISFASDPLIGPSRLCMSCHDGATAVDSHGTAGSTGNGSTLMTSHYTDALGNNTKRFIDDLTVTHPIGFLYADAVSARNLNQDQAELITADQGFIKNDSTNTTKLLANTFDTKDRSGLSHSSKTIANTLYGGYMTCASCHEVHNTINATPDGTHSYNFFLYAKEEGSAICLSCHIK